MGIFFSVIHIYVLPKSYHYKSEEGGTLDSSQYDISFELVRLDKNNTFIKYIKSNLDLAFIELNYSLDLVQFNLSSTLVG